jgi:hypothetical protein
MVLTLFRIYNFKNQVQEDKVQIKIPASCNFQLSGLLCLGNVHKVYSFKKKIQAIRKPAFPIRFKDPSPWLHVM